MFLGRKVDVVDSESVAYFVKAVQCRVETTDEHHFRDRRSVSGTRTLLLTPLLKIAALTAFDFKLVAASVVVELLGFHGHQHHSSWLENVMQLP